MDSNRKGAIAEAAIALDAIRHGIEVYLPYSEHGRYDLVFGMPSGRLLRVQCKWARYVDGCVQVRTYSSRRTADGQLQRPYKHEEVDAIAVYCGELDRAYLIPIALVEGRKGFYLREENARNSQGAAINMGHRYQLGAIAQLEERSAGSRKVGGSSPPSSTPPATPSSAPSTAVPAADELVVGAYEFRNRFGWYMQRAAAGDEIVVTRRGRRSVRLTAA